MSIATPDRVRARWVWIRERSEDYPHLLDLVDAVGQFPQLEVLFPFLSVGRLCFSRCTEYPYYVDFLIAFSEGRYVAEATLARGGWVYTRTIGSGSALEMLALVDSAIPPGYGAARTGDSSVLILGSY